MPNYAYMYNVYSTVYIKTKSKNKHSNPGLAVDSEELEKSGQGGS